MQIASLLKEVGVSQAAVYRACDLSRTVMSRIAVHGDWPLMDPGAPRRVADYLISKGAPAAYIKPLLAFADAQEKAPFVRQHDGAIPEVSIDALENQQQEDVMLLRNEQVKTEACRHFGLARNPFRDDIRTRADVFASPATRYARAALYDAAVNHGFTALIGESGAGKSTLVEELEQRILDEDKPVIIIRPSVLAMEASDKRGKTLKSGQIIEAIIRTLAPSVSMCSSPEARDRQLAKILRDSHTAGFNHLLLIEEAHCLPKPTLKHLKRFLEIKHGLTRLLGIALIAQPELLDRLSEQDAEVREVVQRLEIVELRPLDNDLEAYVKHKFERAGASLDTLFANDVFDAIRARLVRIPRGGTAKDAISICYAQVVNNLIARALNAAAEAGFEKVTAAVIAGV